MTVEDESPSRVIVKSRRAKEGSPYGGRGGINPNHAHLTPEQRCQAHKKTGEQCKLPPIMGARVCRQHGGAAGHVKRAAMARLENAADRMARQLLGIADDPDAPPAVKLAAIKDALDRAGLSPQQALAVTHELKPYEQILTHIVRGPRRGSTPPSDDPDIVDAEVVGAACRECGLDFSEWPEPEGGYPALCKACRAVSTASPAEPRSAATAAGTGDPRRATPPASAGRTGPARGPRAPADGGLLTGEEAVRRAAEGQPRARRKRRAEASELDRQRARRLVHDQLGVAFGA